MALYLGTHKVNLIKHETSYIQVPANEELPELIDSSNSVTVTKESWQELENNVKKRTGTYDTNKFNIYDMNEELEKPYNIELDQIIRQGHNDVWSRPLDWPDLDSLNLSFSGNDDFIYMTYQTGHLCDYFACYIATVSGTATIDYGHISNGTYVVDSTRTSGSTGGTNFYAVFNSDTGYATPGYIVIRITGKIKYFYLINASYSNFNISGAAARTLLAQQQPLLERIAYVPNIINFYSSSRFWGTHSLQRERIGNNQGTACTSLQAMYYRCYYLQSLDISEFYTPNITTLQETFRECALLKSLDIAHWNTSKVTSLYLTFYYCMSLQVLDLTTLNLSKITNLGQTFQECHSLTHIYGLERCNKIGITSLAATFSGCRNLEDIEEAIKDLDTSKITSLGSTFSNCMKLKNLDLHTWDVSKVTRTDYMFNGCYSLKNVYFPQGLTANLTTIYSMFNGCFSLQNVDVSWLKMDAGTCTTIGYLFNNCRTLKEINIPNNWNLTALNNNNYSYYSVFSNCCAVTKITGITNWDLRSSTNQIATYMFQSCYNLKTLDISGWRINSTSYASFFSNCHSLESINISGFDTSLCTNLSSMFYGCYSLKQIIFPSTWDTSKVTTMASMFNACFSLETININFSSWNVAKVTTLESMFGSCYSLKSIIINNWTLSACTNIANIFRYDYSLEEISWTGWSLPKLTSTAPATILEQCYSLKKMTGFPPIILAFNIRDTYNFPADELVNLFNNLQDLTGKTKRTINLRNAQINRLTTAEKAIATNKNWTLAD